MSAKRAGSPEQIVRRLLAKVGILSPPVPVEKLVEHLGATLHQESYADTNLRGFFVRKGDAISRDLIWVNSSQSSAIQRFTIAHEIGHLLQKGDAVHVDRRRKGSLSGVRYGNDRLEEARATQFALELLMPRRLLLADLRDKPIRSQDDDSLRQLAARYDVSLHALVVRLHQIELLPSVF